MRVIGLGAICELGPHALDDPRENSFDVREFALLDDGERVILHAERGWSGRCFPSGSIWAGTTVETITHDLLNVVLPDPENGDDHPWEWLAGLAQARGIDVTTDQLRRVPYEVVLTERVIRQLFASASNEEAGEFKRNLPRWAAIELPVFRLANWDGAWSLGNSTRAGANASDGARRFLGMLSQDVSHRRPDARSDAITVTSSRPDPARHAAQLDKMAAQVYRIQSRNNDTADDANELTYEWEQRLHSGEFPWARTVFSVDGAPTEFQVLVVDDVWFASTHVDDDLDIEILGVHTPSADLRLTPVADPPPSAVVDGQLDIGGPSSIRAPGASTSTRRRPRRDH